MDHNMHQSTQAPKEPPRLTRGLFQGPPLPNTRYPSSNPATTVLKIGDKELTFHMNPLQEAESQQKEGSARVRRGIGRGAGAVGKVELPFSRLERMQNRIPSVVTQDAIESSDWLGESGAKSMPIAVELEGSGVESDWLSEREGMNSNSELESDKEQIPTFQSASSATKESNDRTADLETPFEESDRTLYILRGCPGSGKSTLARELRGEKGKVFSTDDYFVRSDGEYVFDPKKVAMYHKRNQEMAREAISEGVSPVVIDNTNTTAWEMRPYVETGLRHGYRVQFVEPDTSWRYDPEQLTLRNSHGVPLESIKRMLKRFQKNATVESVLGKSAVQRILQETECYPDIEDELSSNQDTLNSSTDECRSAGSSPLREKTSISDVTPLLPSSPRHTDGEESVALVEVPDRYSIILEPEPTDMGTIEPNLPPGDPTAPLVPEKEPISGPGISRTGSLVSNQERFNQQLVQELTNSPRGDSLFCLNLQSLTVLQDILNIDKTLLGQSNFPLAQLLLPPHVISQLTHTQVANFQHNYQRYLQHIMHSRTQESRTFIPKGSLPAAHLSPGNQSIYSQARMPSQIPPVFSHQRINHRLPAQIGIPEQFPFVPAPGGNRFQHKLSNPELKPEPTNQSSSLVEPLTNEKIHFHSNQGMQLNSKLEFDANKPIRSPYSVPLPENIPVENKPTSDSLPNNTQQQQQQQQQISLQQTNDKETELRDEISPITPNTSVSINQLIITNENSYKLESTDDDITTESSDISPTLSPSSQSLSTSGTLENSSISLEKLTPIKPYMDTRALSIDNREASQGLIPATDSIQDPDCLKLTDNQNTMLHKPSLELEASADQSELLESSGKGVDSLSETETNCLPDTEPVPMNELAIESNSVPIQFPSNETDSMERILSEKIDWGDSSDSDRCLTSPIQSPDVIRGGKTGARERALIAPWDTWGGWSPNFITHNNTGVPAPLSVPIVSKNSSKETAKKFDPTIQPPRKHSSSSLKLTNESLEFTPSFSRFRSMDSDAPIRSPRKLSGSGETIYRPKWSHENSSVVLMPAGSEWQWNKMSNPGISKNNGNSEGSSPRSDSDDSRNSKPLNPFAVPWKPFLPSSTPQSSPEVSDNLGHLKGFFPTLSSRELQSFLTDCGNDIDRAVEAIIERAETYNLDLPMSSQVPLPNQMAKKIRSPKKSEKVTTPLDASAPEFKTVLVEDTIDTKWQPKSATTTPVSASSWPEASRPNDFSFKQMIDSSTLGKSYETPSQSVLGFPDSIETSPVKEPYTSETPLVLELDSNLANQLIKQFGPLPGCTKETSLDPSLSHIALTTDTALLLHQLWCKSIQSEASVSSYYVSPGQGAPWVPPEDPIQQAKSQLYNMYPGIDTLALDEILSDKNLSLSAANEYILTALSTAQKASKDSLAPSFALIAQRGSHSFPPLPTKTPRNYTPLFSTQNTKTIF